MFGLGTSELIVILVIVLIVFGPKKLPELGRSLGRGIRAFKKGVSEIDGESSASSDPNKSIEHSLDDTAEMPSHDMNKKEESKKS